MAQRPVGRVDQPVNSLSDLRLSAETMDSVLGHIGRLATQALEGWDAVATTVIENDKVATFGSTDDRVLPLDQSQYDTGKGPCIDAVKTGEAQYFHSEDTKPRWRQFAEVAADTGVYSVFSLPMKLDDHMLGALNFYSGERDALRPGQREEGWLFASQAAVTVSNLQDLTAKQLQVGQLEEGLQTRTMIGQATGLLMAQEGLTSDEAFQKLVKVSQASNVKLRDIAQRYVASWEDKAKGATKEPR